MGLNETPNAERKHIAFFGCRNAGKSSLLNAVTGQKMSIVSDVKGTTTDPVSKAMELLPAGPVVIIDTPGLDDEGELGELRIKKALEVMRKTDIAVLAVDSSVGMRAEDQLILDKLKERGIPAIIAFNKSDLTGGVGELPANTDLKHFIRVSAVTGEGINDLKEKIAAFANEGPEKGPIAADLVKPGGTAVLVIPIDKAAPKGRLILPQQQVIRDLLDNGISVVIARNTELGETLAKLTEKPDVVITDSQAFKEVSGIVPEDVPLTSFSILFSRYKGELNTQLRGIKTALELHDGDKVLIAEGCSHHRQCGDIGTEKIPAALKKISGSNLQLDFTSGVEYPEDLEQYRLIVHCGGCMLNEKEMKSRIRMARERDIPVTNYGMILAEASGILDRSMEPVIKDE